MGAAVVERITTTLGSPLAIKDFEVIKRLFAALEREHVRYAILGAVALNLHGLARFTENLDIFVAPEAGNIERLKLALHAVIDDREIEKITAQDLLGEYPAIQYVPPDGTFHLDILTEPLDAGQKVSQCRADEPARLAAAGRSGALPCDRGCMGLRPLDPGAAFFSRRQEISIDRGNEEPREPKYPLSQLRQRFHGTAVLMARGHHKV